MQQLDQLLRLDAVLTRHQHHPLTQVVLADLDLQVIGNRIHQQLGLDRLLRSLAVFGIELRPGATLRFECLGEPFLVMIKRVDRVVQCRIDLSLNDRLRQRHLDEIEQRLQRVIADGLGLMDPLDPPHLFGQVLP